MDHFQQYSDDLVLNGRSTHFLMSMEGFTDVASNNFQRALSGKGRYFEGMEFFCSSSLSAMRKMLMSACRVGSRLKMVVFTVRGAQKMSLRIKKRKRKLLFPDKFLK